MSIVLDEAWVVEACCSKYEFVGDSYSLEKTREAGPVMFIPGDENPIWRGARAVSHLRPVDGECVEVPAPAALDDGRDALAAGDGRRAPGNDR